MAVLGDLSAKYESSGDPASISNTDGDAGGKSYGAWQLSLNAGSLQDFVQWAAQQPEPLGNYGIVLSGYATASSDFDNEWANIGNTDHDGFYALQHDYIKEVYYDTSVQLLLNMGLDVAGRSFALQEVLWSRAVQYSSGNMVELFVDAAEMTGQDKSNICFSNISDHDLIYNVYEVNLTDPSWTSGSPDLRPGLFDRFNSERQDALNMLASEQ